MVVAVFGVWIKALNELPPLVSRSPLPQDAEGAGSHLVGKGPQGWQGAAGKRGIPGFSVTEGFMPLVCAPLKGSLDPCLKSPAGVVEMWVRFSPTPKVLEGDSLLGTVVTPRYSDTGCHLPALHGQALWKGCLSQSVLTQGSFQGCVEK